MLRQAKARHAGRGGLIEFIRYFWHVLEPNTEFVDGWAIRAVCDHLEAVSRGEINRLLINVPPGFAKSLILNCFWPAWQWAIYGAHSRFVAFSYAAHLTTRDNEKFRDLLVSPEYQAVYGDRFRVVKVGAEKVSSDKTGWKYASSVGGVGTGERGNFVLCFPAYELVWTERGLITIGEIVSSRMPIRVWSLSTSGRMELKRVTDWFRNPGSSIIRIAMIDGTILDCTPNHRIMIGNGQYARADDLRVGQFLLSTPRRVHISSTNIAVPQGQIEMGPDLPGTDSRDSSHAHAKFAGKKSSSIVVAAGNLAHHVFRQMAGSISKSTLRFGVKDVLQACSIFEVIGAGVRPVGGFVANLLAGGTWANKCFGNKLMYEAINGFPIDPECNARVSLIGSKGHKFGGERDHATPFANTHDGAPQTSDASKTGNIIKPLKSNDGAPFLSRIASIEINHSFAPETYCLTVEDNHNMVCGRGDTSIIVSNCDDPHNVKESESETIRNGTVQWFRESMQNRLNDLAKDSIIVIMQRVHEADVSGCIIENYPDYTHLMIPMEFEISRRCRTVIGWEDPREDEGELAWPERYPDEVLTPFKSMPFLWAGQYMQRPEPRGGGIIKRDYWRIWDRAAQEANDVKVGMFPNFEFILASFDGAQEIKKENDFSALTIWGVWVETSEDQRYSEQFGTPRLMLMHAWHKRLTLHGRTDLEQLPGETKREFEDRRKQEWGLVEHIAADCKKFKVDKLIIENKANGFGVASEMRRLFSRENWTVALHDPGRMDKVARAYATQHLFADGMIWRPDTDWGQLVEDELASLPRGAHDDLADSAVQAITHLRRMNFAQRKDESHAAIESMLFPPAPKKRLHYES